MIILSPLRLTGMFLLIFLLTGCGQNSSAEKQKDVSGDQVNSQSAAPPVEDAEKTEQLLQAALEGRSDEVHLILNAGIDVNVTDQEGHTALMFAAFNGHLSIVQALLNQGARVEPRDMMGRTALLYAATGPFPETVKLLLDHGADPNAADSGEHFTPLMHAAAEGHLDVVMVLLEYDADASLKDVDDDDAESFARNAGHLQVADYLEGLK